MEFLYRPSLTPSLIDEAWFPRYDIDEEAMLEAEEADLRLTFKRIRQAKAVPVVGEKNSTRGGAEEEEEEDADTDGSATGSDDDLTLASQGSDDDDL